MFTLLKLEAKCIRFATFFLFCCCCVFAFHQRFGIVFLFVCHVQLLGSMDLAAILSWLKQLSSLSDCWIQIICWIPTKHKLPLLLTLITHSLIFTLTDNLIRCVFPFLIAIAVPFSRHSNNIKNHFNFQESCLHFESYVFVNCSVFLKTEFPSWLLQLLLQLLMFNLRWWKKKNWCWKRWANGYNSFNSFVSSS